MEISYLYSVIIGLAVGLIILLIIHYVGDFPFPWQLRRIATRASEPDSVALSECFSKLSDNQEIHIVMGNVSHFVCEEDAVVNDLQNALEKNIKIKLIHGPEVDERSRRFLSFLRASPKALLFSHPTDPDIHFRVIRDEEGPREVYVEEPHLPYEDHGYRHIPSRRVSREYEKIFQALLRHSPPA